MREEILALLTEEYSLHLVMTDQEILRLKQIRKKTLLPVYSQYEEIRDEERFLYNRDDEQAFIYLLHHNATGEDVGTIRLFFVNDHTPLQRIPMQIYGDVKGIDSLVAQHPVCEVSRLALASDLPTYKSFSALKLRTYLTMGLMATLGINIFIYRYTYIFSIMEPALHRLIKRQGVNFKQIGSGVEYYGTRFPHIIERRDLIISSKDIFEDIALFYLKKLCAAPRHFQEFIDTHPHLKRSELMFDSVCKILREHPDADIPYLLEHT